MADETNPFAAAREPTSSSDDETIDDQVRASAQAMISGAWGQAAGALGLGVMSWLCCNPLMALSIIAIVTAASSILAVTGMTSKYRRALGVQPLLCVLTALAGGFLGAGSLILNILAILLS